MSSYIRPRFLGAALMTCLTALSAVASADTVNWLSQERFVRAESTWASELVTAPDFSPFRASVALAPPAPDPYGGAGATQSSELLTEPEGFFAGLTAGASRPPQGYFSAQSYCRMRFSVSEPREFTIYSNASGTPEPDIGRYDTILWRGGEFPSSGQAVATIWNYDLPPPWPNPVRVDGILQPDVYEFIVSTGAWTSGTATLSSWLLIPEPPAVALMLGALLLAARSITQR